MTPEEARVAVLRAYERGSLNAAWIASQIGESRQSVINWLKQKHDPADAGTWIKIAGVLGLADPAKTAIGEIAHDLALLVLVKSEDQELKMKAAQLIREFRGPYGTASEKKP